MNAHLVSGETATLAERCYLTRVDGEVMLYGVRTVDGRFIQASDIRYVS